MSRHVPQRRVLVLVNWDEKGRWPLLRRLRAEGLNVEVLRPPLLSGALSIFFRSLSARLAPLFLPLTALARARGYGVLMAWNIHFGVGLGLLLRFFRPWLSTPPLVVRDFHLSLDRLDEPGWRVKAWMTSLALPAMDVILTTSRAEEEIYATMFSIPAKRILFLPDCPPGELTGQQAGIAPGIAPGIAQGRPGAHVLAYGNSDRDFETLVAAAPDLGCPVVIVSRAFRPRGPLPDNVRLIQDHLAWDDLARLLASASCCVVPLRYPRVAAGQNTMLEAMASGCPLVVTRNLATEEYATEGETALFFEPGDRPGLVTQVRRIQEDPEQAEAMAHRARARVLELPGVQAGIIRDVLRGLLDAANA